MRNRYITFWVSDEEFAQIDNNAHESHKSRSKFIRDRALRPNMSNNELGDFLMDFFAKNTNNLIITITDLFNNHEPSDKRIFDKFEIEKQKLRKPKMDVDLMLDTSRMEEEQRKKYIESKLRVIDEASGLFNELKEKLQQKKEKEKKENL